MLAPELICDGSVSEIGFEEGAGDETYLSCANRRDIGTGSREARRESPRILIDLGGVRNTTGVNTLATVTNTTITRRIDNRDTLETKLHVLLALSVFVEVGECVLAKSIGDRDDVGWGVRPTHLGLIPSSVWDVRITRIWSWVWVLRIYGRIISTFVRAVRAVECVEDWRIS